MKVELGEIRDEMSRDVIEVIEQVINRFQKKRHPYYLLVYSEQGVDVYPEDAYRGKPMKMIKLEDKQVIRTRILILDYRPFPILGTMCFRIDNKRGEIWKEWMLPQDVPLPESILSGEKMVPSVLESAQIIGKFLT